MTLLGDEVKCRMKPAASYSAPVGGAAYCDKPVCLCVCARAYLCNRWTNLHKILCTDPLWLLLQRRCATLCTSSFMDDVTFSRSGPYEHAQTWHREV